MIARTPRRRLVVGTRTSKLALWQTERVLHLLHQYWPHLSVRVEPFLTKGDMDRSTPLHRMDTEDVFTQELEDALRHGGIDFAVHSLKDLPPADPGDLCVAAVPERADARDVLVSTRGETLDELPAGSRVGTCSLRRRGQLLAIRPDLDVVPIRGNVDDRVEQVKSGRFDATVIAAAGLSRIGMLDVVAEWFDLNRMLPAPAQAALGVQCRTDDDAVRSVLDKIDNRKLHRCIRAERVFLSLLGGSHAPVAAYATSLGGDVIRLDGRLVLVDGASTASLFSVGSDPVAVARSLAARLKVEQGEVARRRGHVHAA